MHTATVINLLPIGLGFQIYSYTDTLSKDFVNFTLNRLVRNDDVIHMTTSIGRFTLILITKIKQCLTLIGNIGNICRQKKSLQSMKKLLKSEYYWGFSDLSYATFIKNNRNTKLHTQMICNHMTYIQSN
uniref:Uncharacterized protein n=1 Tax=Rhizophagus irregularis (strain DAOM 181602 / DAOM 197198 / MUCL 43194) TaxID=747089 RepID=U9TQZ2_RHIID